MNIINNKKSHANSHPHLQNNNINININTNHITQSTLYLMLVLLCVVWMLCYVCQLKIPEIQRQDLLGRLEKSKIMKEEIQEVVREMYAGKNIANYQQNSIKKQQNINTNIDINEQHNTQQQSKICLIVTHQRLNQNWLPSLLSTFSQQYNNHKILYINNNRGSQQLLKYLQNQALYSTKDRFEFIQNNTNINFRAVLQTAKQKCQGYQYVAVMDDWSIFKDQFVLKTVNSYIQNSKQKKQDVEFLYGGMVAFNQNANNNPLLVSQSYAYPQQIIKNKQYGNYPYIINGIVLFPHKFLLDITCSYCNKKNNNNNNNNKQRPSLLIKPAIYLQILMKSSQKNINNATDNIKFIDQILTISYNYQEIIGSNQESMKIQMADLLDSVKNSNNSSKNKNGNSAGK